MHYPLFAYLDDPVSRISAGASSTAGGLFAFAADGPIQVLVGAVVAILAPMAIAAVNRWVDRRFQQVTLQASLAASEAIVAQLKAELARREASGSAGPVTDPPPVAEA